jgi:hypothetical protein
MYRLRSRAFWFGTALGLALGAWCFHIGTTSPATRPLPAAHTLTHYPGP